MFIFQTERLWSTAHSSPWHFTYVFVRYPKRIGSCTVVWSLLEALDSHQCLYRCHHSTYINIDVSQELPEDFKHHRSQSSEDICHRCRQNVREKNDGLDDSLSLVVGFYCFTMFCFQLWAAFLRVSYFDDRLYLTNHMWTHYALNRHSHTQNPE